jgi:hypothetical protein
LPSRLISRNLKLCFPFRHFNCVEHYILCWMAAKISRYNRRIYSKDVWENELRKIRGPKVEQIKGGRRKFFDKDMWSFCIFRQIIKVGMVMICSNSSSRFPETSVVLYL